MVFVELVKKVQKYSGFSDEQSRDTLEMMVESLAVHLTERERRDFAQRLPEELRDIALSVYATEENSKEDILKQFVKVQGVTEDWAKKQITSAWRALKEVLNTTQQEFITSQFFSFSKQKHL